MEEKTDGVFTMDLAVDNRLLTLDADLVENYR